MTDPSPDTGGAAPGGHPFDDLPTPPPAPRRVALPREIWGERVEDPLAWLRNADDPAVLTHLAAENAHVDAVFGRIRPLVDELYDEFASRIQETDLSVPVDKDGWRYYTRTEEGLAYPIHCRRRLDDAGEPGDEEVLLDENIEAEGADYFDLGVFEVSPDHRLLLWGADRSGDERYDLRVVDLAARTADDPAVLDDAVVDVAAGSAWAMDDRTFFYLRLDHAHRPHQVWRHELGTDPTADTLVFEESDERFFVGAGRERDDSYIQIASSSAVTDEVWLVPADDPTRPPRCLVPRRQGVEYSAAHHDGRFLVLTNDGAENFRLVEMPDDPAVDHESWTDLIPHRDDVHLVGVDAFDDHLVLFERVDAALRIRVRRWDGTSDRVVEQPESVASVWPGANPSAEATTYRFGYSSMVTPASVVRVGLDPDGEREILKQTEVLGVDTSRYRTERTWATADDGTRIPMSLVWRDDRPPGPGPALIGAYGAYEISSDPVFSTLRLSLLDRGFVVAIAHVRGGGEMGRRWYLDGKFERKRNTFLDTIACARHLIDEGWTVPAQLGLRGGSAGGLLVGAVLNRAPELFGAAVAQVPFVDALNTMLDPSLPLTVTEWEEWGNPAESEEIYREMRAYTPYENVRAAPYPAILATGGLHDPRVGFWEPAKWVIALRDHTTSGRPILLRTEMGAGHAGPSGRYDAWRDEAEVLAFLVTALGTHQGDMTPG